MPIAGYRDCVKPNSLGVVDIVLSSLAAAEYHHGYYRHQGEVDLVLFPVYSVLLMLTNRGGILSSRGTHSRVVSLI